MKKKFRLAVAGLVAAAAVAAPVAWFSWGAAEQAPVATPAAPPSPAASANVAAAPAVEPSETAVAEEELEVDVAEIAVIDHLQRTEYQNQEDKEEFAAYLNSRGFKVELKKKEEGEPGFTFHVEGGEGQNYDMVVEEYYWDEHWEVRPWSAARLKEHNALVEEWAAALRAHNVETVIHATKNGVKFVEHIGDTTDEVAAKWDFLESKGRVKYDKNNQPMVLPTEKQKEFRRANMQKLVDYLNERGLEAKLGENEFGVFWLDADHDDVDVLIAKEEFNWEKNPMTPEQIEFYNEKTEALAAYLKKKGFACEIKTNRYGLKYADYDRDGAAQQAANKFWESDN